MNSDLSVLDDQREMGPERGHSEDTAPGKTALNLKKVPQILGAGDSVLHPGLG